MNHETKTSFLVFLLIMAAMTLSQRSQAALSLTPVVPGYSAASDSFRSPAGSFSMNAANDGYIKPSTVSVGGKPITVPASMRMASNAGQFAKSAMRLNPWAIAGTLAAGWLIDQGLEWMADTEQWLKAPPFGDGYNGYYWYHTNNSSPANQSCFGPSASCTVGGAVIAQVEDPAVYRDAEITGACEQSYYAPNTYACCPYQRYRIIDGAFYQGSACAIRGVANSEPDGQPATDGDWAGLPDPLPVVGPELPDADYLPDGVAVEAPTYEFPPFSVPVGEPYEKADGSTAQPMAKVSPNGDSVTVDTYDQPLTDTQGDPVPNAPPVDTPEPQPESQTQCDKYPESLGCADLGTVDEVPIADEARSIAAITPVSVGSAGSCPAPLTASFMGQTVSFSYDMPCQFATSLKPLILAIAWLSAGLIFIGGVRQ